MNRPWLLRAPLVCLIALAVASAPHADSAPQPLPFAQNWNTTSLITANDDWSGVPGIVGYLGSDLIGSATGVDPQTVLAQSTVVDVIANVTSNISNGGVAEIQSGLTTNPVVALQGSGTAGAPSIVLSVDTTGFNAVRVAYVLRDLDPSADNAVQAVALQYRVGSSGNFTNVAPGFVADATLGGSATLVTPVAAALPAAAGNKPLVQIRIITTNAPGNDEWVGVDDISVVGEVVPEPTNPAAVAAASPATVAPGGSTLLTVSVTPGDHPPSTGLTVFANLGAIGGATSQPLADDGSNGDALAGDGIFSFSAAVPPATVVGDYTIPVAVSDAQGRTASASAALSVFQAITSVTISQVYGGGGNSGATYKNDFIELFNKTGATVNVSGWSVQYASASGSGAWQVTPLTGSILGGRYYLVQEAAGAGGTLSLPTPEATGTIPMAAGSGKVALVASTTPLVGACPTDVRIIDLVGYGSANCFEGASGAPGIDAETAALRAGGGATDTNDNGSDFAEGAPTPRNSSGLPPTGTGSVTPGALDSGDAALVTVKVTPGSYPVGTNVAVVANLSAIGGPVTQALADDGQNGDATAGDGIFSYATTVTGSTGATLTITATISDEHTRSSNTSFNVVIAPAPTPIHTIQGSGSTSPYQGQLVSTTGVVTAVRPSSFYIQVPDADVDGDANTSEGILVFTGFPRPGGFVVGDLVKVTGTVTEFRQFSDAVPVTEITSPYTKLLASGMTLPAPVQLLPSFTSPTGNLEQLERFEGMRVVANVTAITGTSAFQREDADEQNATSTSNGDFFAVITGVARPMREPGIEQRLSLPSGSPCCVPRFDENPERIRVDSDGQSGASKIEIVAGQTIANLTGVLDYGSRAYTIVPDVSAWTPAGGGTALAVPVPSAQEFTVASFNMERFFDTQDDPLVDDVVLTPAAFETRLSKASLAIRNVLRTPDVVGVQEVENLPTLQTLAARINADAVAAGQPNPLYAGYLFEGNDIGGIDVGFLVRTARVHVVSVEQEGKNAVYLAPGASSPATLNDRPSVVLQAEIVEAGAANYPFTVIVNHLRSLSGINGSDGDRIRAKRLAQAEYLASYIQGRQAANPAERIISVGDYNAFQFSDGYVDVLGTVKGQPTAADQVVLTGPDLVSPDLTNLGDSLGADQYSFLFDGNAQTLDHVLVNAAALSRFSRIAYARNNADFPESLRSDASRPERLSDHDMPVAYFRLPGAPAVTLNGAHSMTVEAGSSFTDPGATASDEDLGSLPVVTSGSVNTNALGTYTLTYSASNGYRTTTITRTVQVVDTTAPSIGGLSVTPATIRVPNHKMVPISLFYTATDLMGTPSCSVAVTSNEPENGLGDGNTEVDWEVVDTTNVRVRAERSGTGSGRVYTIAVSCVDGSGNQASKTATVTVAR